MTPRFVRWRLLPAVYLVFLAGTLVSLAVYFHGRPFDAKGAVVSVLESCDDNPHGYAALACSIVVTALLLAPAVVVFYRQLRPSRPGLALAGVCFFAAGLPATVAIGVLAPYTHGYTSLHIQLASAAFIGISAGTWLHLLAVRSAPALLCFQFAALLVLVFFSYGPVKFDNERLWTSLAFWEWALCADCGIGLWVLAAAVEARAAAGD